MNKLEFNSNEQDKSDKKRERIIRKMIKVSNKYLRRLNELSGLPYGLDYFINILKRIYVDLEDIDHDEGVMTVGTYCIMVPQELIYASGAIPVKLCSGSYAGFSVGDEITPRDSCPLVKSVAGFYAMDLLPMYKSCSLTIVPTTCDCKKKMAYLISNYKDVIMLHVPTLKNNDESKENFLKDLYMLKDALEKVTSNKITYSRLKIATEAVAYAQQQLTRFYKLKMHNPPVIKGTHAMAVMNSYAYVRVDGWAEALEILNNELEIRIKAKKYVAKVNTPRIMITGSPIVFPNIKIPLIIEESGGILVADETCMGERGLYDPVAVTENTMDGIMRALAARYILPSTCPSFVDNAKRIYKIKQMIEDFKIEGVVYHVLRGCQIYDFEYRTIAETLDKMNIPVIRIETDYNDEDVEQLRIRLEAFIEIIKYKEQ